MKRILIALLTLILALSMAFTLVSCDDGDKKNDNDKGNSVTDEVPEEKKPVPTPEGYTVYNNGKISFAYPANWIKQSGSVDILINQSGVGNNVTVSYEQYSDTYKEMTVASFNTTLKPYLEAAGMTVTNVSVEQLKNENGTNVTKIAYSAKVNGVSMGQTMYVVAVEEINYIVTVTETEADAALVSNVYNTLNIVK